MDIAVRIDRNSIIKFILPRLQDILFLALFIGVIGLGSRLLNVDGDLGRHLTIGRYILQNFTIPTQDLFSHTMAGQLLTPHEWLAQVIYSVAYQAGGMNGVVFLCALLIALTFTLCFRQANQRSGMVLVSLGFAIFGAAAASLHWLARPHLFTLLLVVIWVSELERIRKGDYTRWWILPIIMLLWANLHGAFIAGFVILGVYLVGVLAENVIDSPEQKQRSTIFFLISGIVSVVASIINPSGWRLWATSLGYIRNRYLVGHTAEYLSPDFHNFSTIPFLALIALALILIGLYAHLKTLNDEKYRDSTRTLSITSIGLLSVWIVMGLYSVRNIPIFAILAAPILAELTSEILVRFQWLIKRNINIQKPPLSSMVKVNWFPRMVYWIVNSFNQLDSRLSVVESSLKGILWPIVGLVIVGLGFAGGARLDFAQQGNRFDPTIFPVEAVNWLKENPQPGNVFNYFPWGGYLLFREWPDMKVFIDGQTDFYGEALTRQYEQAITLADGWLDVLNQYQVKIIIMPSNSLLVKTLSADPAWCMVYQDKTALILSYEPNQ